MICSVDPLDNGTGGAGGAGGSGGSDHQEGEGGKGGATANSESFRTSTCGSPELENLVARSLGNGNPNHHSCLVPDPQKITVQFDSSACKTAPKKDGGAGGSPE